jgi:uncharacterized protein (TIGR02001 family)
MGAHARPRSFALLVASGLACPCASAAEVELRAAIASEYVFRGIAQSDDGPVYQVLAEIGSDRGVYAGVWASRVEYPFDDRSREVDWFAGWQRRISDAVALDVSLVRYTYDAAFVGDDTDWTELQIAAHLDERWSFLIAAANGWLATDERTYVAEATYRYPLPAELVLDATYGEQFANAAIDQRYSYAEVGLSRVLGAFGVRVSIADTFGAALPTPLDEKSYALSIEWAFLR